MGVNAVSEVDYYQLLGIKPTATLDEIRSAYRKLARRYHPDSNPEWEDDVQANRRMAQLNEVYATLRDPARRAEYDHQRWARIQQRTQHVRYYEQARARTQPIYQSGYGQTYTQAGARTQRQQPRADPFAEPPGGWPQLVFVPPSAVSVLAGVILLLMSLLSWALLTIPFNWSGVLIGATTFIAGALFLMAAMPYFQGYIVLTKDRLIEYPTFGLWAPREFRYEQICDVQEQVFRSKSGVTRYVLISYFKKDTSGRWDVTRYYGKRLMRVQDHYALLHALRVRARARKFLYSKPTFGAVLIELGQLTGMLAGMLIFLIVVITMAFLKNTR